MSQPLSPPDRLQRFTRAERWAHRSLALVMGVLMVTAAFLFFPDLGGLIGNRRIVSTIHEWAGWLVPLPILLALFSRAFRDDSSRLNRFHGTDWEWLRSRDRRSGRIPVGKFNAGQKLNSAFTLGAIIVMFGTGMVMFFSSLFTDNVRTGATFVHDWLGLALGVVVLGHIWMAYSDATARAGMRTGEVPRSWAEREHGAWAAEPDASSVVGVAGGSGTPTRDEASGVTGG